MWPSGAIQASSVDPARFEAAITGSGLTIVQSIELHGEWRERFEEDGKGFTSRQLLWGVYQMIGKLSPRLYVLSR